LPRAAPTRSAPAQVEHTIEGMVQRVFGIALGPVLGQGMPDPELFNRILANIY
jgi:hypothetical protein